MSVSRVVAQWCETTPLTHPPCSPVFIPVDTFVGQALKSKGFGEIVQRGGLCVVCIKVEDVERMHRFYHWDPSFKRNRKHEQRGVSD